MNNFNKKEKTVLGFVGVLFGVGIILAVLFIIALFVMAVIAFIDWVMFPGLIEYVQIHINDVIGQSQCMPV